MNKEEPKEFPLALVEKDVRGEATPNEVHVLNSNLALWKLHLVEIMRNVDSTIVTKKSESLQKGPGNYSSINEFTQWKRGAVFFKNKAIKRLGEVKKLLHEANQREDKGKGVSSNEILSEILEELRYISQILETKNEDNYGNG